MRFNFWTPDKTREFIREYERHEVLWNPTHPHRRLASAREHAYDTIGRVFGKPVMSRRLVVNRIRYLRGRYSNLRRTLMRNPETETQDWFVDMDSFLAPFQGNKSPQKRPTKTTTTATTTTLDRTINSVATGTQSTPQQTSPQQQRRRTHINGVNHNSTGAGGAGGKSSTASQRTERQQQILQQLDQQVQQSMRELRLLAEEEAAAKIAAATEAAEKLSRNAEIGGGSEFDVFGRNVSLQLSKLGLGEALHCQLAIQSVLRTFRLRQQQQAPLSSADRPASVSATAVVPAAAPYSLMASGPNGTTYSIQSMMPDDDVNGQADVSMNEDISAEITDDCGDGSLLQQLLGTTTTTTPTNGHSRQSHRSAGRETSFGATVDEPVIVDIMSDTSDDED